MDIQTIAGPEPAITRREADPVKRAQKLLKTKATGRELVAELVASLEEERAKPKKLRQDQMRRMEDYRRRLRAVYKAAQRIMSDARP